MNLGSILVAASVVWGLLFFVALPVLAALMRSSQISKIEEMCAISNDDTNLIHTERPQASHPEAELAPIQLSSLQGGRL